MSIKISSKGKKIGKKGDTLYNHFVWIPYLDTHLDGVRISDVIQHVENYELEINQNDILKDYEELKRLSQLKAELEKSLERRILPLVVKQAIKLETVERMKRDEESENA